MSDVYQRIADAKGPSNAVGQARVALMKVRHAIDALLSVSKDLQEKADELQTNALILERRAFDLQGEADAIAQFIEQEEKREAEG